MGQAAWILEKFHGWSDLHNSDLWDVYEREQLVTNLMIYLINDAFATSVWFYNGFISEGSGVLAKGDKVEVPTGFCRFGKEPILKPPPLSWIKRLYNLVYFEDMPAGGHFAAMEQPELFTQSLRTYAREL